MSELRATNPRLPVRLALACVLGGSAAFVAAFAYCAFSRLDYPWDIEWMEGGMITHAARLLDGVPIYARPSTDFVAFFYTPGYARLLALLSTFTGGLSFTLARTVSLAATFSTLGMLFYVVRREADVRSAILAVGLYAALYRTCGTFYDLARADALAQAVGFAGALVAYYARSTRGAVAAAALFVLAFFTKQTSAIVAPFVGLHLLTIDRRRAFVFGAVGAFAGFAVGELEDVASGGWFRFYTLEGHHGHGFYVRNFVLEYWRDLLFLAPFVVLVPILGASYARRARLGVVVFLALLVAAFAQRIGTIGYDPHAYYAELWYERVHWHIVVPPLLIGALLVFARRAHPSVSAPPTYFLGLLLGGALASALNHSTQWAYSNCFMPVALYGSMYAALTFGRFLSAVDSNVPNTEWAMFLVASSILVQLTALLYDPSAQVPSAADRAALANVERELDAFQGPVLMPAHPMYSYRRDGIVHLHQMGIGDVAFSNALRDLPLTLQSGRFPTVVVDSDCDIPDLQRDYLHVRDFAYEGPALLSRTGFAVRPASIWVRRRVPSWDSTALHRP